MGNRSKLCDVRTAVPKHLCISVAVLALCASTCHELHENSPAEAGYGLQVEVECDSVIVLAKSLPDDDREYFAVVTALGPLGPVSHRLNVSHDRYQTRTVIDSGTLAVQVDLLVGSDQIPLNSCLVPIDCDGVPVIGSLPMLIWYAPSLSEAEQLFARDSSIHANDCDRYFPLWWGKLKSGFSPDIIQREIENVRHRACSVDSNATYLAFSIAMAVAQWFRGDCDRSAQSLESIRDRMQASAVRLSLATLLLLDLHVSMVATDTSHIASSITRERAILSVGRILLLNNNPAAIASFLRLCHMRYSPSLPRTLRPLVRSMLQRCEEHMKSTSAPVFLAANIDILPIAIGLYTSIDLPSDGLRLFKELYGDWRHVPEWFATDAKHPACLSSKSSLDLSLNLAAGEAAVQIGDSVSAIRSLTEAFYRLGDASRAPRSYVAYTLGKWTLGVGDIDAAHVFRDSSASLESPFAADLAKSIDSIRAALGMPALPRVSASGTIVATLPIQELTLRYPLLGVASQSGKPYCIVFTSETCGLCRTIALPLATQVAAIRPSVSNVIIAVISASESSTWKRRGFESIVVDARAREKFGVSEFPSVFVVCRNRLIRRWDEFGPHTAHDVCSALMSSVSTGNCIRHD